MVNRLFQLEQELARQRQQSQQEFSAAQGADDSVYDSSPDNRLQKLQQDLAGNQSTALNPIAQAQSYDAMSFEQSFDDYDPILDDEPNDSRPAMAMQLVSAQFANNQTYSGAFQGKRHQERIGDTLNYLKGLLGEGPVSHIQANKLPGGLNNPGLSERISLGDRVAVIKDDEETERRRAKRAYILLLIKLENASDAEVQQQVQNVETNYQGAKARYDFYSGAAWARYDKPVDFTTLANKLTEMRDNPLEFMKRYSILPDHGRIKDPADQDYGLITVGGPDNVPILPRMLLTPSGANEYAFKLTYAPTTKQNRGVPIYFLPWKSARIVKMTLGNQANIFFTAAINGCSVFVEGDPATPTVYHAGINPPWPNMAATFDPNVKAVYDNQGTPGVPLNAPLLWRELYWSKSTLVPRNTANFGEVNKTHYIDDGTVVAGSKTTARVNAYYNAISPPWTLASHNIVSCIPWGGVFGIRNSNTNQWSFYLQENATIIFVAPDGKGYGTSRLLRLLKFFPQLPPFVYAPPNREQLPDLTVPNLQESSIFPF